MVMKIRNYITIFKIKQYSTLPTMLGGNSVLWRAIWRSHTSNLRYQIGPFDRLPIWTHYTKENLQSEHTQGAWRRWCCSWSWCRSLLPCTNNVLQSWSYILFQHHLVFHNVTTRLLNLYQMKWWTCLKYFHINGQYPQSTFFWSL